MRYTVPSTLVLYQYLVVFYVRYFSYFLFLAGVCYCALVSGTLAFHLPTSINSPYILYDFCLFHYCL